MALPYEPHESVREHLGKTPLATEPSAIMGHVPEYFTTNRATYDQLGLVSKHGPLMTKKSGSGLALDSADDTPYECRVSTHAGKPMGTVFREKYGGNGLRRTQNWDRDYNKLGMGYTAWSTQIVNEYWNMGKVYTYPYEGLNEPAFERLAEMLVYIDCPLLESKEIPEDQELVGAVIRKCIVDVYFHEIP